MNISIVVLSCDSQLNKHKSLLITTKAILLQDHSSIELIIVDNSNVGDDLFRREVTRLVGKYNKEREFQVKLVWIVNKKPLSRGEARNRGIATATNELIVFTEDDTAITTNNALSKIANVSKSIRYGYGARRLWIEKDWLKRKLEILLSADSKDFFEELSSSGGLNTSEFRGEPSNILLTKTFIANFGYCFKTDIEKLGGFPDFGGYGFEDDYVMYRFYEVYGNPMLLDDIDVVHFDHEVKDFNKSNLAQYFKALNKRGVYWFHVAKFFTRGSYSKSDNKIEPLGVLHYDYRIEDAYDMYLTKLPLNLADKRDRKFRESWASTYRFDIREFARQISRLANSESLDSFVKRSRGDFDSLAIVIEVANSMRIISILPNGRIQRLVDFRFTKGLSENSVLPEMFVPNQAYNQFPCDYESVQNRVNFLKRHYPYAEYLRLGIVGDDDLLSCQLVDELWVDAVVVEKDKKVLRSIRDITGERHDIVEHDVANLVRPATKHAVETFITDPPYTLHGALAFLYTGLSMMAENSEGDFFVVLNKAMMGKNLYKLQGALTKVGITLTGVEEGFSDYKLPLHFQEKKRADKFLKSIGVDDNALSYSSSSDLYIFHKPAIFDSSILKEAIDVTKIYEHYK